MSDATSEGKKSQLLAQGIGAKPKSALKNPNTPAHAISQ